MVRKSHTLGNASDFKGVTQVLDVFFSLQHIVDAVLAIRKEGEPIDLHMVEVMEMQHKTDMDTM